MSKHASTDTISQPLLAWFDQHGRHDLPWQDERSLYRVWISEIMLQQTQVATVIPYFERFMQRFPNLAALAAAGVDEVLHLWTGLGYYARARNLLRAAQHIVTEHGGAFPQDIASVTALPGIGRSTAGAILAQALGQRHAILDGNVKRVLSRLHTISGWPGQKQVEQQLWQWAEAYTPTTRLADYTQAIMDLGATVCTRRRPRCEACPLAMACRAHQQGQAADYPSPKPRATLPVRQTRMLLIRNQHGQFLLQQRPPQGLWGGLWSLPECPDDSDITTWCQQALGLIIGPVAKSTVFRHSFSHFHLDILPLHTHLKDHTEQVMEGPASVWYNTLQPEVLGLPGPVKTLLEQAVHQI